MTERSSQSDCRDVSTRCSPDTGQALKIVIHASLTPDRVLAWRMSADSDLRVQTGAVWLTREGYPDDYWLRPGDAIGLRRKDRVWLSTDRGEPAEFTLTCHYRQRQARLQRWLARIQAWLSGTGGFPLGV